MSHLLVFTDLDGTLLDHHNYSYEDALPAIRALVEADFPLIFNSSKTASEVRHLHHELENSHPFIVENGSAVCVPSGYFQSIEPGLCESETFESHHFGPDYQELVFQLHEIRKSMGCKFKGFADLTDEDVAKLTGLNIAGARKARLREASEPVVWEDTEEALDDFQCDLHTKNLTLTRGGRFYHVMGQTDKALAMQWTTSQYRKAWPEHQWVTVALGDGPNDRAMLEAADIAVTIPPASGEAIKLSRTGKVICPNAPGPSGWQAAIETIMNDLPPKGAQP